jgi:hypothetical protein
MNENFELENMRQQMALLKQKLEQQEIVNDSMIRQSVKKNASFINNTHRLYFILDIISIPFTYLILCYFSHLSIWIWLYITCGLIYDAWHRRRICRLIDGRHLYEQNLLEVRKKVLKVKKYERTFNIISYPAITLWLVLFFYNSYLTDLHPSVIHTIVVFIIAVAFCFGLGLYLDRKMARHYQDIIQQIEDVTNSEEQEET